MREIVLDTETTGLSHRDGHRVAEIGCVELWDYIPTGRFFQTYINPEREMSKGASQVSGLTSEFLRPFPLFQDIVKDFLDFIEDTTLIIHNASFDIGFLNAELDRLQRPPLSMGRVIDTVSLARQKFPGSPANLDALCKRFQIDLSKREKHGALLDSELLAQVYLELRGGRQRKIQLETKEETEESLASSNYYFPKRSYKITTEELKNHEDFLKKFSHHHWKE